MVGTVQAASPVFQLIFFFFLHVPYAAGRSVTVDVWEVSAGYPP